MAHNVRTNKSLVDLPGVGRIDVSGTTVTLTDSDFSLIPAAAFAGGSPVLTDLGQVGPSGDAVLTQATFVAAAAALTSVQNATAAASDLATAIALANALKANYNALQADVAALRTTLVAEMAALQGVGKAQAAS